MEPWSSKFMDMLLITSRWILSILGSWCDYVKGKGHRNHEPENHFYTLMYTHFNEWSNADCFFWYFYWLGMEIVFFFYVYISEWGWLEVVPYNFNTHRKTRGAYIITLTTAHVLLDVVVNVLIWWHLFAGTIMCYGQTGAGKTFTMTGATEDYKNRGIIPLAIQQIFRDIDERSDEAISIRYDVMQEI